jgi:hypothetical protein
MSEADSSNFIDEFGDELDDDILRSTVDYLTSTVSTILTKDLLTQISINIPIHINSALKDLFPESISPEIKEKASSFIKESVSKNSTALSAKLSSGISKSLTAPLSESLTTSLKGSVSKKDANDAYAKTAATTSQTLSNPSVVTNIVNNLTDTLSTSVNKIFNDVIINGLNNIFNIFGGNIIENIGNFVDKFVNNLVKSITQDLPNYIKNVVTNLTNSLKDIYDSISNVLDTLFGNKKNNRLAKQVDSHVNHPDIPRKVIVVNNTTGEVAKLPENARLTVRNSHNVHVNKSEGSNDLNFTGVNRISTEDIHDSVIRIENSKKVKLGNLKNCEVYIGKSDFYVRRAEGCTVTIADSHFNDNTTFVNGTITVINSTAEDKKGLTFNGGKAHIESGDLNSIAINKGAVISIVGTDLSSLTGNSAVFQITKLKGDTNLKAVNCAIQADDCQKLKTLDLSECNVAFHGITVNDSVSIKDSVLNTNTVNFKGSVELENCRGSFKGLSSNKKPDIAKGENSSETEKTSNPEKPPNKPQNIPSNPPKTEAPATQEADKNPPKPLVPKTPVEISAKDAADIRRRMYNLSQLQTVLGSTPDIKNQVNVLAEVIKSNDATKLRELPELDTSPLKNSPVNSSDIQKYQTYQNDQLDRVKEDLHNGRVSEAEYHEIMRGIKEDQAIMEDRIKRQ